MPVIYQQIMETLSQQNMILAIMLVVIIVLFWRADSVLRPAEKYRNPDAMADPNMYSFGPVYYMPAGPLPAGFGN